MARHTEAVIDASVAIKWFNQETGTPEALQLRDQHIQGTTTLTAPNLILYEIANALRYNPQYTAQQVTQAIDALNDTQIDLIAPGTDLLHQTIQDAYQYDITVYDATYLALAQLMGTPLITADKKLYTKTHKTNPVNLL
jgi:predicted nucleic acid-binding protein